MHTSSYCHKTLRTQQNAGGSWCKVQRLLIQGDENRDIPPTEILLTPCASVHNRHLQQNIIKNMHGEETLTPQLCEINTSLCITVLVSPYQSNLMQFCCSSQIISTTCFSSWISPQAGNLHSFSYNQQMLLSHTPHIHRRWSRIADY